VAARRRRRGRKGGAHAIFERPQLNATQLLTVADRRLEDATYLANSGLNARANGAMYLAGFAVECCLKSALLRTYPWLRNAATPEGRSDADRTIWMLCYRSHALDEIVARLPGLREQVRARDQLGAHSGWDVLREVCSTWTIMARYSPLQADSNEAGVFVDKIKEIRRCLAD
jgi:hypothetical protein